jgi:hypothetical protein
MYRCLSETYSFIIVDSCSVHLEIPRFLWNPKSLILCIWVRQWTLFEALIDISWFQQSGVITDPHQTSTHDSLSLSAVRDCVFRIRICIQFPSGRLDESLHLSYNGKANWLTSIWGYLMMRFQVFHLGYLACLCEWRVAKINLKEGVTYYFKALKKNHKFLSW